MIVRMIFDWLYSHFRLTKLPQFCADLSASGTLGDTIKEHTAFSPDYQIVQTQDIKSGSNLNFCKAKILKALRNGDLKHPSH
ncbi:MAG: hypothetical protein Q4C34_08810 [Bacteroidales bacterium]|nr:hypothetical protein [Bacteroidales bacterium]